MRMRQLVELDDLGRGLDCHGAGKSVPIRTDQALVRSQCD